MIAMIAAIAELFFSATVAIIWNTGLRDRNTYTTLTDDLSLDQKCMGSLSGLGVKEVKF